MIPAILAYRNSNNLGDYIQSIAAAQLLKTPPLEIDRDELSLYQGREVGLIMNGWFMEKPENWPPSNRIHPLYVSFHINPTAAGKMLTSKRIEHFKKHEPIGCRDYFTKELLERHGIKASFTGCLTLSLKRDKIVPPITKRRGILLLSVFERMLPEFSLFETPSLTALAENAIQLTKFPLKYVKFRRAKKRLVGFLKKQHTEVEEASQIIDRKKHNAKQRKELATNQLKKIARAKCVITSRIHTALPAVALGTPVIFLSDGLEHINQSSRLRGLDQFFPIIRAKDLEKIDLRELSPMQKHIPFAERMERTVETFLKKVVVK